MRHGCNDALFVSAWMAVCSGRVVFRKNCLKIREATIYIPVELSSKEMSKCFVFADSARVPVCANDADYLFFPKSVVKYRFTFKSVIILLLLIS